jgi:hypothetical protein
MSILDSYNKLIKPSSALPNDKVDTHIPTPNSTDYGRGYITRYFLQKSNDKNSPIFEVNTKTYSRFTSNPLFVVCSIKWRLTGPKETTYRENGDLLDLNVSESNRRSIKSVYEFIPLLKSYLPNLLQFYK